MEIKTMRGNVVLLTNAETESYALGAYVRGVTDGIGITVGSYILYRIGRFLVKGYIDYRVEKHVEERTAD